MSISLCVVGTLTYLLLGLLSFGLMRRYDFFIVFEATLGRMYTAWTSRWLAVLMWPIVFFVEVINALCILVLALVMSAFDWADRGFKIRS